MTNFFIDLWHDLREKRLWPVAVGLVAAIAAIPLVLFKPAAGDALPGTGQIASIAPSGVQLPALSVDVNATDQGSKLDTFTEHNPFKPMKDLDQTQTASTASTTTPSTTSKTSSSGGSGSGSPSTASPSSGSTTGGSSAPSTSQVVTQHTTSWIYTATFKFGTPGHMKTMKDVKPFTMLPDDTTASLIFASVGADGKSAIFYINDARFQAEGEGHCNLPGAKCRFVTLTTSDSGNEEAFISSDGTTEYDVQLVSIGKQTLDPAAKSKQTSGSAKGKQVAGAGKKPAAQASLDFLPVLLGFSNTTTQRTVTQSHK